MFEAAAQRQERNCLVCIYVSNYNRKSIRVFVRYFYVNNVTASSVQNIHHRNSFCSTRVAFFNGALCLFYFIYFILFCSNYKNNDFVTQNWKHEYF
jgi:hypothetical protein